MEEVAPNFCPNCGCQSSEFSMEDIAESKSKQPAQAEEKPEDTKKNGCSFLGCVGIGAVVLIIGFIMFAISGNNSEESTTKPPVDPKILAKNVFVDSCVKKRMHDPKSYKEEDYVVYFDAKNDEYVVTVSFRGNNVLGKPVLSTCKGGVKFSDNYNRYQCRIISE
jgi:hypothetical protein